MMQLVWLTVFVCLVCTVCLAWLAWSARHHKHRLAASRVLVGLAAVPVTNQFRAELDSNIPSSIFPRLPAAPSNPNSLSKSQISGIPHVVYRTWPDQSYHNMPGLVQADKTTKMVLARHSPDWQHLVFDNQACQAFVEQHFAAWPAIIWAYNALNYGVMKADFWRYLVIYQNGGMYLDMKSSITDLPTYLNFDSCDKAVVMAWPFQKHLFRKHGEYVNWMVMAPPKSEFLWQVVWQVVRNVQAVLHDSDENFLQLVSWFGEPNPKASILCLTGPIMYTYVARTYSQHVYVHDHLLNCFKYDLAGHHHKAVLKASHYSKQAKQLVVSNTQCPSW